MSRKMRSIGYLGLLLIVIMVPGGCAQTAKQEPNAGQIIVPLKERPRPLQAKDFFETLPLRFLPEKATGVNLHVAYEIRGEGGGTWTIHIQNGVCKIQEGVAAEATAHILMTPETYLKIALGKLDARVAFMLGKLKITGDKTALATLNQCFKGLTSAEVPERELAQQKPSAELALKEFLSGLATVPKDFFETLPSRFLAEKASGVNLHVVFEITGAGGGAWTIHIQEGACKIQEGSAAEAATRILMTTETYLKIAQGTLDERVAFMLGKLKIKGDKTVLTTLNQCFKRVSPEKLSESETDKKTSAAELALKEFLKEFGAALQAKNIKRIQQLITDNPTTAEQAQQEFTKLGKGTDEKAKKARVFAEMLQQFRARDFRLILQSPVRKSDEKELPQELPIKEFTREFIVALQAKDIQRIQQLFMDNPTATERAQQELTKLGKGTDEKAKKAGAFAEMLQQFRAGDFSLILSSLDKEAQQAYTADDYQTALKKWQTALEMARALNNKQSTGLFLNNIGVVYESLGQYQEAIKYDEEALAIHREIGDRRGEGSILTNLGIVYRCLGQYQQALKYAEQALVMQREFGDRHWEGDILTNLGVVYESLGQYQQAMKYAEQALIIRRELNDRKGEKMALLNLGVVYNCLGQYQQALSSYEQALVIAREIGDRSGESAALNNLGSVYQDLGEYQQALKYDEQALSIVREIGDRRGERENLLNLGNLYAHMGQYQQALSSYEQALVIAREIGDRSGEGAVLNSLGSAYQNIGQYQQSLKYGEQALSIARKIGDRSGEGAALNNIGIVYSELGQYQQALSFFEQNLSIAREIGDQAGEGGALGNIGDMYRSLGQPQLALNYLEQVLSIARRIGDRDGEGGALGSLGNVYNYLGQYQEALACYEQALVIAREIGDPEGESINLNSIGMEYNRMGQYQEALTYNEQALAIDRKIGSQPGEGSNLTDLGIVYYNLEQHQKAFATFQQSLSIAELLGTLDRWIAQLGLALVNVKLNQPESAIIHYEQALDTIEQLRAGLTEKEQKLSFMQDKLFVYDELITLLQNLHQKHPDKSYDRKALEIFERKQGRMFLEEMGQSGARNFAGIPAELLEKELDLENQLEQTRKQLVDQRSKPLTEQNQELITTLETRKQSLSTDQEKLQTTFKTGYPDYYALRYPKPVALADLQQNVLQPGELLLVYHVMKESALLWVVGKEQFGLYPLALSEAALTAKVEEFRKAITEPMLDAMRSQSPIERIRRIAARSLDDILRNSAELADLLLPSAMRPLLANAQTLYIVPTGALYGLPFEALTSPASATPLLSGEGLGVRLPGVRYLIEDHAMTYLSSASLLKSLRDAQQRRQGAARYPLLAFANPVYRQAAAANTEDTSLEGLTTRAYLNLAGGQFAELPETEAEVKDIQTLLNAPEATQPLHLREDASRSTVFNLGRQGKLADYRYVVFSCHGVLPGEINQVTQPALVLSLPDPVTRTDDYLTMADVFGLQFNAQLITLSACNTGRGQQVNGEGVLGLTRAFMYAGTPALSITLWSVESQSARLLSTGLYSGLNTGASRVEALRASKLHLLHGEEDSLYQHPFFWAPVVMFGDGQ